MDSFIEYMIKQKRTTSVTVKKILIYLAALLVNFVIIFVMLSFSTMVISFIPLVTIGVFYAAYRINSSFDIEYEYIVTNGELDIDKITHRIRRKRLLTIHSKSFIEFGILQKGTNYFEDKKDFDNVIDASAKSESFDDYYAVFYKNGQKIKLVFNPTKKMIDVFKLYAPRVVK